MRITLNPSKLQLVDNKLEFNIVDIENNENNIKLFLSEEDTKDEDFCLVLSKCDLGGFFDNKKNKLDLDIQLKNKEFQLNSVVKSVKTVTSSSNENILILNF